MVCHDPLDVKDMAITARDQEGRKSEGGNPTEGGFFGVWGCR